MKQDNILEIQKNIQEMSILYKQIFKDTEEIKAFRKKIIVSQKRIKKIEKFYYNEWTEYYEALDNPKSKLTQEIGEDICQVVMGQDAVYNAVWDQYLQVKKLLKKCSNYIM